MDVFAKKPDIFHGHIGILACKRVLLLFSCGIACDTLNRFCISLLFLRTNLFLRQMIVCRRILKKYTVYNKTVIVFGFCDTRKYEDHITVSVIILAFI